MGAGTLNTLQLKSSSPNGCFFGHNHVVKSTTTRLPFLQEFRYSRFVVRANDSFHQINVGSYGTQRTDLKWARDLTSHNKSTIRHVVGLLELEPALSVDLVVENKNKGTVVESSVVESTVVEEKVDEKQEVKVKEGDEEKQELKVKEGDEEKQDLKVKEGDEEKQDLKLDGGFVVPDSNAFGNSFRDYNKESERKASVEEFYRIQHINQTYEFATKKKEEYGKLDRAVMSIWECCELLNEFVDDSDPDLDEPQIEHLLQTAEAIRRDHPDEDWLHLTALIHDLGKVLLHHAFGAEPQWAVVGDTFPLGCAFNEAIVHHQYFKDNADYNNPKYNTKLGIYFEKCGLDNVTMSWGHDEYMYLVAKENKTTLPPAALFIIRFHSFYALHRANTYTYLMNEEDEEMLKWLRVFNKYDLYSKSKVRINLEEVKPYYLSLIEKYFPAKLRW